MNRHRGGPATRAGFTLIELLVVIIIIAIIASLVAVATFASVEQAEKRATQSLITKLSLGVADRLESLGSQAIEPNGAHRYLAAITPAGFQGPVTLDPTTTNPIPCGLASEERARVIALIEAIRMDMPDDFFIQFPDPTNPPGGNTYPFNFGALNYPDLTASYSGTAPPTSGLFLPIGNRVTPCYVPSLVDNLTPANKPFVTGPGAAAVNPSTGTLVGPFIDSTGTADSNWQAAGRGVFGATYAAAAGLNKNIGYLPAGTDGIDNDSDAFVDEWDEGVTSVNLATVTANLAKHQHRTARSEMLYAMLVEGRGPLGSVFDPGDFTAAEVGDTDGDGLPEFLDAWGNPLQFYRQPVFYPGAPTQKGIYDPSKGSSVTELPQNAGLHAIGEERQINPLDPGGQLVAPAWWASASNVGDGSGGTANSIVAGGPAGMSNRALATQALFGPISTPAVTMAAFTAAGGNLDVWDRSWALGTVPNPRMAFYSKPLILSGGKDGQTGIFQIPDATIRSSSPRDVSFRILGVAPYAFSVPAVEASDLVGESNALAYPSRVDPASGVLESASHEYTFDNITNFVLDATAPGGL